jgi:hypothetical protein
MLTGALYDKVDSYRKKIAENKRSTIIDNFVDEEIVSKEGKNKILFYIYLKQGIAGLTDVMSVIEKKEILIVDIKMRKMRFAPMMYWEDSHQVEADIDFMLNLPVMYSDSPNKYILIDGGVVFEENGKVKIDNSFLILAHQLEEYLKKNNIVI